MVLSFDDKADPAAWYSGTTKNAEYIDLWIVRNVTASSLVLCLSSQSNFQYSLVKSIVSDFNFFHLEDNQTQNADFVAHKQRLIGKLLLEKRRIEYLLIDETSSSFWFENEVNSLFQLFSPTLISINAMLEPGNVFLANDMTASCVNAVGACNNTIFDNKHLVCAPVVIEQNKAFIFEFNEELAFVDSQNHQFPALHKCLLFDAAGYSSALINDKFSSAQIIVEFENYTGSISLYYSSTEDDSNSCNWTTVVSNQIGCVDLADFESQAQLQIDIRKGQDDGQHSSLSIKAIKLRYIPFKSVSENIVNAGLFPIEVDITDRVKLIDNLGNLRKKSENLELGEAAWETKYKLVFDHEQFDSQSEKKKFSNLFSNQKQYFEFSTTAWDIRFGLALQLKKNYSMICKGSKLDISSHFPEQIILELHCEILDEAINVFVSADDSFELMKELGNYGPSKNAIIRVNTSSDKILNLFFRNHDNPQKSAKVLVKKCNVHWALKRNVQLTAAEYDFKVDQLPVPNRKSEDANWAIDVINYTRMGHAIGSEKRFVFNWLNGNDGTLFPSFCSLKIDRIDRALIKFFVSELKPRKVFEFGTFQGETTKLFLDNSTAKVVTINLADGEWDSFGKAKYAGPDDSVFPQDAGLNIGKYYKEAGLALRVDQLLMDSRNLDTEILGENQYDLVFIDGGHDAEIVRSDTKKAIRLVRPGGFVLWHDFCPSKDACESSLAISGVVSGLTDIRDELHSNFENLFWIRPSLLLVGKKVKVQNDSGADTEM